MSNIPEALKYSDKHEWVKVEDDLVRVGITDFAQNELTDVVYVELPQVGDTLGFDAELGIIESVKSTSDVFCPIAGEVVEVNSVLEDRPELINQDCYGDGWLAIIRPADMNDVQKLLTAEQYREKYG